MPSMFWGGFGQGISGGLRQGQDMVLKAKEHKLRAKMLENQAEQMQLETQKRREDLEERDRQRRAGEAYAQDLIAEFTGGTPGVAGFEDPTQQMSVAPVPAQPGTRQMDWRQRGMVEAARSGKVPYGELFKQPTLGQVRGITPGSFIPDPNAPGGFRQIGTPTKESKQSLTEDQIGQLYPQLSPERRRVIASLPFDAQEKSLDNLRAQAGQEQSAQQFKETKAQQQQFHREGISAAEERENRREQAQLRRQESGLRGEHQRQSKNFILQRDNLAELEATSKGGAIADHALIFKYLKVLDPTSTVREGEFATVRDTRGLPERVGYYLKQIWSGQKLTPSQRREIIEQARRQYNVAKSHQQRLDDEYRRLAAGQGIDPNRVVIDYSTPSGPQQPTARGGGSLPPPPAGWR